MRIERFTGKRKTDWNARLSAYVVKRANMPFDWKDNDCGKYVGGAVKAMTGKDPMKVIPEYETEAQSKAVLKKLGVRSHISIVKQMFEEIAPGEAQPGDIVVCEGGSLGILQGAYVYRPGGSLSSSTEVTRAFRVGEK